MDQGILLLYYFIHIIFYKLFLRYIFVKLHSRFVFITKWFDCCVSGDIAVVMTSGFSLSSLFNNIK